MMTIFRNVQFKNSGMSHVPNEWHYDMFKDLMGSSGLKHTDYVILFNNMFTSYCNSLPKPKKRNHRAL